MMQRRDLFMRLAAITAAVTLAPAVKAEAAPLRPGIGFTPESENGYYRAADGLWHVVENGVDYGAIRPDAAFDVSAAIADARAEGYERGRAIRDASAESTALRVMRAHNDRAMTPQQLAELVQGMVKTFQDGGIIA